jgi:hypothetical protein
LTIGGNARSSPLRAPPSVPRTPRANDHDDTRADQANSDRVAGVGDGHIDIIAIE